MKITSKILTYGFAGLSLVTQICAQVLHEWSFGETAGTGIEATSNTGASASSGSPTWSAPSDNNSGDWATTGTGALRITGNNTNVNTLAQSVVSMSNLNSGVLRFEWDVSWVLTVRPGVIQETFLINRDGGGSNRFRWTLQNPSGEGDPLFRLNLDGNGFTAINNVTASQNAVTLNGTGGNLVLRTEFTLGDVGGNNGVTGLVASYNYNDSGFTSINLGTFTPYVVSNLNDLRLHSKGALSTTDYLDFNNISVAAIPEPSATGLLAGFGALALVGLRRRR